MSSSAASAATITSSAAVPGTTGGMGADSIVLLTFPYSGAEFLSDLISSFPGVVCTSRTGVIPLCHAAADTWASIERRGPSLSPLAVASVRSMASQMLCVLAADSGGRRWCETVVSGTPAAETFLSVFPGTRFICFYRRCDSVIADVLSKNPWGLGDTDFWRHFTAGQGNSVATIAAYWSERVQSLLDFELAHAPSSMRVRLEDLEGSDGSDMDSLCEFLALPLANRVSLPTAPSVRPQSGAPVMASAGRIPPAIRHRVNELHARLGYSAL